jgi:acetyl esterase
MTDHLVHVSKGYLGPEPAAHGATLDLADPLLLLERREAPDRPWPPTFAAVGTKDPLLDDTRRLVGALSGVGADAEAEYYPGEFHAFHAFVFREQARRCWRDTYRFLDLHLTD